MMIKRALLKRRALATVALASSLVMLGTAPALAADNLYGTNEANADKTISQDVVEGYATKDENNAGTENGNINIKTG